MFNHVESCSLPPAWCINDSTLTKGEIPYVPGDSMTPRLPTADTAPGLPVMAIENNVPARTAVTGRTAGPDGRGEAHA